MQTNPYEDERPLAWIPQENQFYELESDKVRSNQHLASLQYQKRLIVASLVVFGLVSGLVAFHPVGSAANQGQVDPSQSAPATQPSNGGFFDQQSGNNFGSGGYWQPQQPSSGTGVS
jgi:hypothetical protein